MAHMVASISLAIVNLARCGATPASVISRYFRRKGLSVSRIASPAACLTVSQRPGPIQAVPVTLDIGDQISYPLALIPIVTQQAGQLHGGQHLFTLTTVEIIYEFRCQFGLVALKVW